MKKQLLFILMFATTASFAQNVNIPDANFKAYLVGHSAINTNSDTEIQVSEASAYTETIDVNNSSISDLTGIEAFTSLEQLRCKGNFLTSIDVSQNTALIELDCRDNQLTAIDVSQNASLVRLMCGTNQLTSLDVSQNPNLSIIIGGSLQLTSLNLGSITSLTELYVNNSFLTSIDVSQNTGLTHLYCYNNQITDLDLSMCTQLLRLKCYNNELTSLNVKNGDNMSILVFEAGGNPNLSCIEVDNASWSTSNWNNIDGASSFSEDCSGTTGISEVKQIVKIYPNPVVDVLNLNADQAIQELEIYDLNGRLVKRILNPNSTINLEALERGLYTLKILSSKGVSTTRLIKS